MKAFIACVIFVANFWQQSEASFASCYNNGCANPPSALNGPVPKAFLTPNKMYPQYISPNQGRFGDFVVPQNPNCYQIKYTPQGKTIRVDLKWKNGNGYTNASYVRTATGSNGDFILNGDSNNVARIVYMNEKKGLLGTYVCRQESSGTCSDSWRMSSLQEIASVKDADKGLQVMSDNGINTDKPIEVKRNSC
jgi:hypothetical protein